MGVLIRLGLVLALLATPAGWLPAAQPPARMGEPEAKANFLYHLALFATWPPANGGGPLNVCVAGVSPVSQALRAYDAQVVVGRRLLLRDLRDGDELRSCHILFVPVTEARRLGQMLQHLARHPVITVGENDTFLEAGGMLRLTVRDARLRLDVELEPADRAGISFDSTLLAQAASVTRGGHVVRP